MKYTITINIHRTIIYIITSIITVMRYGIISDIQCTLIYYNTNISKNRVHPLLLKTANTLIEYAKGILKKSTPLNFIVENSNKKNKGTLFRDIHGLLNEQYQLF